MANLEKVKIVVIGDSGVGKTSLVHLICHNESMLNPDWTIGCSVEVKLHDYKAGTPAEKSYFVEMWDVGGFSAHQNSRSIFYNSCHGIILVHDLTNRKSQQNLRKWLAEVLNRDRKEISDEIVFDPEQFAGSTSLPILVIGTKLDLAQSVRDKRSSLIAEECGADEINVDCSEAKHLAPGSSNSVKLSRFFDKVIQRKYYSKDSTSQIPMSFLNVQDRRRQGNTYTSGLYTD